VSEDSDFSHGRESVRGKFGGVNSVFASFASFAVHLIPNSAAALFR
jgi:hypothetical protein